MGIDYRAVIAVGLRRKDIENFNELRDEDDELCAGQFEDISSNCTTDMRMCWGQRSAF
jgi:hypothetical protein